MAKPTFSDLAANPVRRVGFLLRLQLLLTGPGSIALKVMLSLVTVCVFSDASLSLVDLAFEVRPLKKVEGKVQDTFETNININDRAVSGIEFSYPVGEETWFGMSFGREYWPKNGTSVRVEMLSSMPRFSRIEKTAFSKWGVIGIALLLAAFFSGCLALWKMRLLVRRFSILTRGTASLAKLVHQETHTSDEGPNSYTLTFTYDTNEGVRTYKVTTRYNKELLDEKEELLLYLPKYEEALLLDELKFVSELKGDRWKQPSLIRVFFSILTTAFMPVVIYFFISAF